MSVNIGQGAAPLGLEKSQSGKGTLEMCFEGSLTESEGELLLLSRCLTKKGTWLMSKTNSRANEVTTQRALDCFDKAAQLCPGLYSVWHGWAWLHYQIVQHEQKKTLQTGSVLDGDLGLEKLIEHARASVEGFFKAISIGGDDARSGSLQDILRVLTIWFDHGHQSAVAEALKEGFNTVPVDVWLQVVPQIIARIGCPKEEIRNQIHQLLFMLGCQHPQAIIYSIMVAAVEDTSVPSEQGTSDDSKQVPIRATQAARLLETLRAHSPTLVAQAQLVSRELIRTSVLWPEMWHESLDEAAAAYFIQHNGELMIEILEPLHKLIARGPETLSETHFLQCYGSELSKALACSNSFKSSGCDADLSQAWRHYKFVFDRIKVDYLLVV